jgi:methylated-DNA-[protein]-cysteine S-methyltransferase
VADVNDLERALKRAAPPADDERAERAARAFAERAASEGLADVSYAVVDSPLGPLVAATTPRGLVRLAYDSRRLDDVLEGLAARLSPRVLEAPARLDSVRRQLDEYFEHRRDRFELPLDWSLTTGFTQRVLRRTARIPYGDVLTYTEVAAAAGSPRGSRAAGNALGANPIPIVVPCHRVVAAGHRVGGYTGGPERKEFLLGLEGALEGLRK